MLTTFLRLKCTYVWENDGSCTKPLFNTNAKKDKSCLPEEVPAHGLIKMSATFYLDLIIGIALIVCSLPFLNMLMKDLKKKTMKRGVFLIVLLTLGVLIAGGIAVIASAFLGAW
jgi:hypothetical protein